MREDRRGQLEEVIVEFGVVRVRGLSENLDIFRRPNNLKESDFEECWRLARTLEDSPARVVHPVDLLATKLETGRDRDQGDITFIEAKIRTDWNRKLASGPPAEAVSYSPGMPIT